MEAPRKKVAIEQKLATILKAESLQVTMRHKALLKAERPKDGKSFLLFKVDSSALVPKIDALLRLGLFGGIQRVFGCDEYSYAELCAPEAALTLSSVFDAGVDLTETHLAALLTRLVRSKDKLLRAGLSEIRLLPELVFLEKSGKVCVSAIDAQREADLFGDFVAIFKALIRCRCARASSDDGLLSKSLLDLISLVDRLSKLNARDGLDSLHPKHRELWEKVVKHAFLGVKFQKQTLAELYQSSAEALKSPGSADLLHFEPQKNAHLIVVDRICWKSDLQQAPPSFRTTGETSDSSGGSNSSHAVLGPPPIGEPAKGSQEWKTVLDKQKSQLFLECSRAVIEKVILKTKTETSSSFLVNALENFLQTIASCEELFPAHTEKIIREVLQHKEKAAGA